MRLKQGIIALAAGALAVSLTYAGDARACGGCFVQQSENTQVTSHRMILSISPDATTLWDQILYSGAPEDFAWVLPVVGLADVGLSSDGLFAALAQATQVQILSPTINCNPGNCPGPAFDGAESASSSGAGGAGGGVTVVAQETVGPYETVQLRSTDPTALRTWLATHRYNVPPDISPVIDAYVREGFDFLALKLVPGQGVSAMRPVLITTPGASPTLPLRMVAAGTGAVTPITLWILGEGRYEPTNFGSFEIGAEDLTWNWDTQSSDYATVRSQTFAAASEGTWLVEAAEPLSTYGLRYALEDAARYDPIGSGYADENGEGALEAVEEDLAALFSTIPENALWVTRLYSELPRAALANDLDVSASMNQAIIPRFLEVQSTVGRPPECPPPPVCDEGGGFSSGAGVVPDLGGSPSGDRVKLGSCAIDAGAGSSLELGVGVAIAALALARRRRRRADGAHRTH